MIQKSKNPLILIDASGYVFRAYHVLGEMSDAQGRPTQVIFGVLNMLRSLRKKYKDNTIIAVFDGKGKGIRSQWLPEYKAHRVQTPKDLIEQIPVLQDIIRAQGIPLVIGDGFEADDLIAHLCAQAPSFYKKTYIVTRDKDLAQLVDKNTLILADERKEEFWDAAAIEEKYGVPPNRIVDYLSLIGDTVDNIPGVPGVGKKTAAKLLEEYDSLDGLIEKVNEIQGKVGENIRASLEQLPLIRKLNTLIYEVTPALDLKDLQMQKPDTDTLRSLYTKYTLSSFLRELEDQPTLPDTVSYQHILTREDWEKVLSQLKKTDLFAFDLETTGLEHLTSQIVGFSFSLAENQGYYVPCAHDYIGAPKQLDIKTILEDLAPIFANPQKCIVAHNAKYDFHILANHNALPPVHFDDTMLMAYVCSSGRRDLKSLSLSLLKRMKKEYVDIAGKGTKQLSFNQINIQQAGDYAAEDSDVCFQIRCNLAPKIEASNTLKSLYETIDKPLLPILLKMERHGILLDTKLLAQQSTELDKSLKALEKKIYASAGSSFNINSPAQLQKVLYDDLKLSPSTKKKTSGGQPSTAESVLVQLVQHHELPSLILDYRTLSKLKNTYTDSLPKEINAHTKRVHTSFHQAAVATGRLSSVNPNLQNIPIRNEEGRRIRKAFIAPPGCVLASADYSQIELRIMAHLSDDKALLDAFAKGMDIHKATAAEVFGEKIEDVTDEQRRRAKAINFGLIYGMSAFGLANQLQIERHLAQEYIDMYFSRYPGVLRYMEDTRSYAEEKGWTETLSGRRVYTPNITSSNFNARQGAQRAAINAPVQGTAADLIKMAMIAIDRDLDGQKAVMILQVHDELLFEIKEAHLEECQSFICNTMENVQPSNTELKVSLTVDFGYGDNWDTAH